MAVIPFDRRKISDEERAAIASAKRLAEALANSPFGYEVLEAIVFTCVKKWGREEVEKLLDRAERTC